MPDHQPADANVRRSILARQSFWDRIDTAAKARGVSVNALVKDLCSQALDAAEAPPPPAPQAEAQPQRPRSAVKPLDTAPAWMRRGWSEGKWR